MVLDPQAFRTWKPGPDPYAESGVTLKLDDLPPRWEGNIRLTYMMSTWNRSAQLARSLEMLARQEWREFEVLLNDDGSTEDIEYLVKMFEPHLNIRYYYSERTSWISCASKAFKRMLLDAQGEVVAIAHPEMMLHPAAMWYLYHGVVGILPDAAVNAMQAAPEGAHTGWRWVSLKPVFIQEDYYHLLDEIDWHSDIENLLSDARIARSAGFAGRDNLWHANQTAYPWWFVAAAHRTCPIWDGIPAIKGHGIFDMWLVAVRCRWGFDDIIPDQPMCYHQPHLTSALAPRGEQDDPRLSPDLLADAFHATKAAQLRQLASARKDLKQKPMAAQKIRAAFGRAGD